MDELVQSVVYYNQRPILLHGYLAPFFLLQAAVFYYFTNYTPFGHQLGSAPPGHSHTEPEANSIDESSGTSTSSNNDTVTTSTDHHHHQSSVNFAERHSFEIAVIAVAVSFAAQLIAYLFCHWSVDVKCWLSYSRCNDPFRAKYAKVTPTQNNGSTELVPLQRGTIAKQAVLWFVFQKAKYVFNEKLNRFVAIEFPCDQKLTYYKNWKGYQDQQEVHRIEQQYGRNELDMVIPEFGELFKERATAPFFVFQIFCVGLWCLDEFWYYSVFTLFMLVTFEVVLVKHQLRNMQEIRRMGNQPYMIQVFRQQKWKTIRSDQLIHGDLVAIIRSEHSVPCDILLVRGSCIVDESTLTGESIPQMKEPIEDLYDVTEERTLDVNLDKLHILFGGTKVLQHTAAGKEPGCVGYVLRTGFQTSQGKLLRTILFGVKRVTANSFETFCFIMFLLFFAVISAYYVWTKGIEDPKRSRYRLFFECTVIITSVVPPELPIELSLAVNSSLLSLSRLYIYCTEPFRIPFAGKVEYCCFDKTGTLTSDDLVVEGVAGLPKLDQSKADDMNAEENKSSPQKASKSDQVATSPLTSHEMVTPISQCPIYTQQVLSSCHSLAHLDEKLVGDPLEKKVLEAIEWNFSKSGVVSPKRGRAAPLKIHQRFHFNSLLKRMSVIASYKMDMSNENVYICTAKGAPEFMRPLMKEVPSNYDDVYLEMSRLGARVLALGYKTIGQLTSQEISDMKREDVEKDLMFAGFVLISCPLKPDSRDVCLELMNSGHRLVMITGDGALTACHVASVLNFVDKEVLILTKPEYKNSPGEKKKVRFNDWSWVSADKKIQISFDTVCNDFVEFSRHHDLCLTGESIEFIMKEQKPSLVYEIIRRVKVFARVSPKQKELIITTLKQNGTSVLMCGDGTNDVGALKHADVGVALLSSSVALPPQRGAPKLLAHQQQQKTIAQSNDENVAPKQQSVGNLRNQQVATKAAGPRAHRKSPEERKIDKLLETQAKLREMLEEQERGQFVKLGDASIAAPFTSRLSSTQCISHIIKQGRCTLVTTLQMFKILALNALLSAYCHSVLYLDGIKFSDSQVTLQGLLSTFCFLFITRSQPLSKLSAQRPLPNIFNLYTILTVTLQFAVHFSALVFLYSQSKIFQAELDSKTNSTITNLDELVESTTSDMLVKNTTEAASGGPDDASGLSSLHTEFKPSLINSTVYIIWMSVQLATFAVNYKGHPFMQDLRSNRPLCYSFIGSAIVVFACVNGWSPNLAEQLSVVEFPLEYRPIVLATIVGDFFGSLAIDRLCEYLFGRIKLKPL
jgi:cation-transporting ATPase 13A1